MLCVYVRGKREEKRNGWFVCRDVDKSGSLLFAFCRNRGWRATHTFFILNSASSIYFRWFLFVKVRKTRNRDILFSFFFPKFSFLLIILTIGKHKPRKGINTSYVSWMLVRCHMVNILHGSRVMSVSAILAHDTCWHAWVLRLRSCDGSCGCTRRVCVGWCCQLELEQWAMLMIPRYLLDGFRYGM